MTGQSDRSATLPDEVQGHWIDGDGPSGELLIKGGEVRYQGASAAYTGKIIGNKDGALAVDVKVLDPKLKYGFQRENISGLVTDPEGDFQALNGKFASQFARLEQA